MAIDGSSHLVPGSPTDVLEHPSLWQSMGSKAQRTATNQLPSVEHARLSIQSLCRRVCTVKLQPHFLVLSCV